MATSQPVAPSHTRLRRAAAIAALAITYLLTARIGLALGAVAGFATLVWPPTGLAIAVLILRGAWLWPGVALGAVAVNVWVGAPPAVAAGIAAGNTLEALAAVWALRRLGCDWRIERVADVTKFVLVAAVASTTISATIGVASLVVGGIVVLTAASRAWVAWWLGDVVGALVVAPVVLVWARREGRPGDGRRTLEAIGLIVMGAAACALAFGRLRHVETRAMYVLFPPMAWAAARFGQRGATASTAVTSLVAIVATALGHGPFVRTALSSSLFELQSFMAVVAITALALGAAVTERDRATDVAIRSVRARDDFVSIASHELRTPLSALTLQLSAARRYATAPAGHGAGALTETLASAERQTDRLAQLVSNLLDVSRIEAGQLSVQREALDLRDVVLEVVAQMRSEAERASCALTVRAEVAVPGAWDRLRVEQALTNLLSNAFRHAAGADVEVVLAADDGGVTLVVSDRGPGIAREKLEEIFGRYHRGGAAREVAGLGLGLYIVRHIVEAHGGTITADDTHGSGTRFTIRMPRRDDHEIAKARSRTSRVIG